jgi:acyl carrier protein
VTREQILNAIRAHLADELEVDGSSIEESTRFREDLEADSLDLYTLVQELEDSYGVKISDDEATRILTVGQAVEFVLASGVSMPPSEMGASPVSVANSTPTGPAPSGD